MGDKSPAIAGKKRYGQRKWQKAKSPPVTVVENWSVDWEKCQAILQRMKKRQIAQAQDEQELADRVARLPNYLREQIIEQRRLDEIAIQRPLFAEG